MNQHLSNIELLIQQSASTDEEKQKLLKEILNADKQWNILELELDRTEQVKKTTAVLLEETIEELEQKRKAVEAQNRELVIEGSLERVRSVAMSMKEPVDMLEVCKKISEQLASLNVKEIRNVQTAIFYEGKGTYMNYEYYAKHDKTFITETSYTNHEIPQSFANQMLKGSGEFFSTHIPAAELKEWIAYQRTTNVFIDTFLETTSSLNYYWYSLGPVALGISTYLPLGEDEMNLFKRFLKVFELAYSRYTDIEKAEAQAREAQIELGLERVRARAMAMQKSDELAELVDAVFKELIKLDFALKWCIINIIDESSLTNTVWAANPDIDKAPESYYMKFEDYPFHHAMMKGYKERRTKYVYVLEEEEKKIYDEYLFTETEFRKVPVEAQAASRAMEKYVVTFSFSNFGGLQTVGDTPLTEDSLDILSRFGKVFDLTYTRFNDLQKAEAQARESQIQLALERVRARTMAMQHSDELSEAVYVLFQQFKELGEKTDQATIGIINEDEKVIEYWVTMYGKQMNRVFKFSIDEPNVTNKIYKAWKENKKSLVIDLSGNALLEFMTYRAGKGGAAINPDEKRRIINVAFFSKGLVNVQSNEERSAESIKLLERFASVFEQTYTRFLDLQKAEAQAREAQIEASLERVRSRSMAMRKSDELKEAGELLWNELGKLGISSLSSGYVLMDKDEKIGWIYAPNPATGKIAKPLGCLHTETKEMLTVLSGWKKQEPLSVIEMNEQDTIAHQTFIAERALNLDGTICRWITAEQLIALSPKRLFLHNFNFKQGYLMIVGGNWLNEEQIGLMLRFTKVFQQTYTRFLDLQNAEAQAREAQIEAALERVRSRSMGMQKSEELKEIIKIVYQQLTHLKINLDHSGFVVDYTPRGDWHFWIADERDIPSKITHPYFESVWANQFNEAKEKGADFFATQLNFEEKNKFYNELLSYVPGLPDASKDFYLSCPGLAVSTVLLENVGLYIENFSGIPYSDEENRILMRFGKVFQQTYTRFLDLQKAEAQARESQIQLALERARAQSMMMQHSTELDDTLSVFHEQVLQLGIPSAFSFLWLPDEKKDRHIFWAAWAENNSFKSKAINYPLDRNESATAQCLVDWKSNEPVISYHVPPAGVASYFVAWNELIAGVEQLKPEYFSDGLYYVEAFMKYGCFGVMIKSPLLEEEKQILPRLAIEFERAYTRFLDLQKAEAQARESQIQLALERVRARTMAMQKSDELPQAANLLFQQVQLLGMPAWSTGYCIWDEDKKGITLWMSSEGVLQPPWKAPLTEDPSFIHMREAYERGVPFYVDEIGGEELVTHYKYMRTLPVVGEILDSIIEAGHPLPTFQIFHLAYFSHGFLLFITYRPVPEAHDIFQRFAKVFDQTYTRFLDLQKAEAQAREAKIEAALERVRSRSLGMHKSDELQEVVQSIFERLNELNIEFYTAIIVIFTEGSRDCVWWLVSKMNQQPRIQIKYAELPYFRNLFEAKENGKEFFSACYSGEEKKEFYNYLLEGTDFKYIPEEQKKFLLEIEFASVSVALTKNTGIHLTRYSEKLFSEQDNETLKRFARVFDQAYVRFLDLQKAEAQAREAQIEASLERVRSRTTIMQKSEELRDVIQMVFEQLRQLHFKIDSAHFNLNYKESDDYDLWSAAPGQPYPVKTYIPYFDHPAFIKAREAKEKGLDFFTENYTQEEKNKFFEHLFKHVPVVSEERKKYILSGQGVAASMVLMNTISLWIMNYAGTPYSDAENAILKRFGKVFEQTYTRFLDLQKAEALARETKIELGLERVRARAMAMQNSAELGELVAILFEELTKLDLILARCIIWIFHSDTLTARIWMANSEDNKTAESYSIKRLDHPYYNAIIDGWMKREPNWVYDLKGQEKKSIDALLFNETELYRLPEAVKEGILKSKETFVSGSFNNFGLIEASGPVRHSEEQLEILNRFGKVFDLSYTRFNDLQIAEASAKEAVKQAALDRIRADIASMRTVNDLDRITPLIWNELTVLGVSFIRCGVFIMDDAQQLIHTFLSTPDGKSIAAFHLPYTTPGNIQKVIRYWHDKRNYTDHWDESAFTQFAEILVKQNALSSTEEYLKAIPHEGFHLHFLPFLQGMLYVGNITPLNENEIKLIQSVAYAFSTAYARYEDFNKLEAAKKQIEKTLVDLKQAQQQLVQSEKMASLGELTAGVAHEIQNPLNFVNNFSEVSNELIEELKGERSKVKGERNEQLEDEILNDIEQNLEKIIHHGKRADAIVKGMLQHSRVSTGQKEPTDINALADEYLRLSYHGLRAKDKSFNATLKTDFDENLCAGEAGIGKINIVPQDIGRVLLNLYNNAFYAVGEKKKNLTGFENLSGLNNYEPTVSVRTKKVDNKIEITIRDNGIGIPQKVVDKIFQPFFTTKPTGQGTGLGLSLSYDIIKAHGGEIKVETKEGEGATFTIQLSI